ncbi:MAG: TonB-dependent receptor [Bacteroidota bacterium]|nr:MAG: TonB-dependent receptor [Bacteroidota bacterium]
MKSKKHLILFLVFFSLMATGLKAQVETVISGTLMDLSGSTVIGANVYVKGTTVGTVTGLNGNFKLSTSLSGEQTLVFSSVGMASIEKPIELTGQAITLGIIEMESDAVGLAEVMVFADVAIDRRTPVAVSNVKPEQIEAKLGSQEFPEILKSTPGVYATKQGGAFGDSRINIRGFNARYVAVMINGVPVNDMENNWVYWSNWAGLSDVTRSMQVQRGLGAAKVAIPSVGGTINILTKTTDAEKGGNVFVSTGDNNYNKMGVTVSSGLTENNWATTFSLSRTNGDGWVDGTQFESYSYFLNVSKRVNDQHRLSLSVVGAPQWHGQRSTKMTIGTYKDPQINNIAYNKDWGYKNGQVYHIRKNYYHKPMAVLNHFWDINSQLSVSTAAYVSTGTGGGTGYLGTNKFYDTDYLVENQPDVDRIVDENIQRGSLGSETILRSSVNNHFWTGILPQVKYKMDFLTLSGGLDLRYYVGKHYQEITDLLGGQYWIENKDVNNPNDTTFVGDKIQYNNDGVVGWYGGFAQAEVVLGNLSAFAAASLSQKSYKRVEYFLLEHDGEGAATQWYNFIGYSFKGGANYNLSVNHNVFMNLGYFTNPPDFRSVFYNNNNNANTKAPNEKVYSVEAGYGFRNSWINGNINVYSTTWKDKARVYPLQNNDGTTTFANLEGINALHNGIELDMRLKPISNLDVTLMGSIGDWRWMNDLPKVYFFNEDNTLKDSASVFIKDVHVGDAAQTTAAIGVNYELLTGLFFGADYTYYDRLYANFQPENRNLEPAEGEKNPDAWQVPSFGILDANIRYKFKISNLNATLVGNMNNLLDTEHITDADDGGTWESSTVYYGWGRSWRVSLKIDF